MSNSIYYLHKGINKSIEFQGLRAQYIWYFGGMVVSLLILFAVLYICGLSAYVCIGFTGSIATAGSFKLFSLSHEYGEHGLMKAIAQKRVPKVVKSYTRKNFQHLTIQEDKR